MTHPFAFYLYLLLGFLANFLLSSADSTDTPMNDVRLSITPRFTEPRFHTRPTVSIIAAANTEESAPMSTPPSPFAFEVTKPDIAPAKINAKSENAPHSAVGSLVKDDTIAKTSAAATVTARANPAPNKISTVRPNSFFLYFFIFTPKTVFTT